MAWATLDEVRLHVGLLTAGIVAMEELLGSFGNRIANVAIIPEAVWRQSAAAARIEVTAEVPFQAATASAPEVPHQPAVTRMLTPVETGQVGMLWRICSRIFWTHAGNEWESYVDFDVMLDPPARPAAILPVAPAVVVTTPPAGSKFKQSSVTDQGDDSEFSAPTRADVDRWNTAYFAQEQSAPAAEEEPTEIQVKGFEVRVLANRTPYTDMAIWGPFGRKLHRALKFRNWQPTGNGDWIQKEMPGPDNFYTWTHIWRVFVVACKMIRAVMGWALNLYYKHMERLVERWPECWHLIYCADDMLRSEHLERIRRRIVTSIAEGHPAPRDWDAASPWTACFVAAVRDKDFWDEHVTQRAMSWMAHGARGVPKAREDELASRMLPGGAQQINAGAAQYAATAARVATPQRHQGGGGGGAGRGRSGKKRKRSRGSQQQGASSNAQQVKAEAGYSGGGGAQPPAANQRGGRGGRGGRGRSGRGGRGGGRGNPGTVDPESACFGYSKGFGSCQGLAAGSKCANGRTHKCHLCGGSHAAKDKACEQGKALYQ